MAKVSRQARAIANKDHALKLALEARLIPALRRVFGRYMRDFRRQFKKTGVILNAVALRPSLSRVLNTAYKRTAAVFRQQFIEQQKQDDLLDQSQEAIDAFMAVTLPRQISFIINTTNDQITNKIRELITASVETGTVLDISQLADLAFQEYNKILSSRIDTIAMSETQNIAEETKLQMVIPRSDVTRKQWVAILDNRTRASHAKADGQVKLIDEPFIVMDQRLMRPRDTSLGATLDNIINCRCSAVYT